MNHHWSTISKTLFVFLFSYLVLYTNSCQFIFSDLIEPIWAKVVPWFAAQTGFEGEMRTEPTGSGDTSYDYYKLFFYTIISCILMIIAFAFDLNRKNYSTLFKWLIVLVRYYLAMQMINYGLAKVFYMQFSFPSAIRLEQPLGEFSPMGLLWTFMGYSKTYTVFTGIMEFAGGILLLSRRTSTLGALITFGVMTNVMMMNYCYDVPVKLLSTHMVLMSTFLILLDGKRLINFFFIQSDTQGFTPNDIIPERYRKIKSIVKWLLIIGFLGYSIFQSKKYSMELQEDKKSYFYGKHEVSDYAIYSDSTKIMNVPDSARWQSFYKNWKGWAMVKTADKKEHYHNFEPDEENKLFRIKDRRDAGYYELPYEMVDSNTVHVRGVYFRDSLSFTLIKQNMNHYQLVNRGFHWVNERPYNR